MIGRVRAVAATAIATGLLAGPALPVAAQTAPLATPASPPMAPVDPVRLAASRDLIDTIMPASMRAQMLDSMVRPMIANVQHGLIEDPNLSRLFNDDPRAHDLFQRSLQRQTGHTLAAMPGMWEAMARAYARRFDIAQMREIKAFFATPTGRLYMQQATTIMSDPDIARWQQQMMHQTMSQVRQDVAEFAHDVAALEQDKRP